MGRQKLITSNPRYLSLYEKNYLEGLGEAGVPERVNGRAGSRSPKPRRRTFKPKWPVG